MSRARDAGLYFDDGPTGPHNAITDVPGVAVGHRTLSRPPTIHSGVTAVRFGDVNPTAPLPAGLFTGNGYGKLVGATQLTELGQIEAPILLTATLSVFRAADALVTWMLRRPDCRSVRSFNPVVGECNDGVVSDIRARPVTEADVLAALDAASPGPVAEGNVGAGCGTIAMGFKAGIGTASRRVEAAGEPATLGVLTQANFGGTVRITGRRIRPDADRAGSADVGSCVVVLATDAPLDARQLGRLARRGVLGLGRAGASYSHGSGDYGIAVSTRPAGSASILDEALNPLFAAALDAVEESVLNALWAAEPVTGADGRPIPALRDALE